MCRWLIGSKGYSISLKVCLLKTGVCLLDGRWWILLTIPFRQVLFNKTTSTIMSITLYPFLYRWVLFISF